MVREKSFGEYTFTTDSEKVDYAVVIGYLKRSYWASDIPPETSIRAIKNSLCFSILFSDEMVGFSRVVTDFARFAYLADVFVLEEHRGKGLSKLLMEFILAYPGIKGCRFLLATRDAHGLYAKYGFKVLDDSWKFMLRKEEKK